MEDQWSSLLGNLINAVPSVALAIIALISGWLVARTPKKGSNEQTQITALQKDIDSLRQIVDDLRADQKEDRVTIERLSSRELGFKRHIWSLHRYIIDGCVGPVPEPPPSLEL